jgi:hypothetical protein
MAIKNDNPTMQKIRIAFSRINHRSIDSKYIYPKSLKGLLVFYRKKFPPLSKQL